MMLTGSTTVYPALRATSAWSSGPIGESGWIWPVVGDPGIRGTARNGQFMALHELEAGDFHAPDLPQVSPITKGDSVLYLDGRE
jgi:hypothetical protein